MPKKKKKELQVEHNQLLSIFDNIDEPVYVSDPVSYEILYANNAIRAIFGDVVGRLCYRAFQKEEKPCSFCTNDRIFGVNEGTAYSWLFQNKANSRWYRCIDKAIPWPDGRMVRYEMAIDVTDQKKAEEDLNRFFNLSLDMLAISGFDGYARRVNPAFEKSLGFTQEEILSKPFLEFVHPDDRDATIAKLGELARGGKVSRFDQRVLCKDGSYKWVSWTNVPVVEEGLMYAVARDISEHKRMEEELRQSENRYKTIIENAGTAIAVIEEDTTLCFVNSEFEKLSGYSREELVGKMSWTNFFRGNILRRMKEYHRLRRINPTAAPRNYESVFVDRFGHERQIYVTVAMLPESRRSVAAFQDISGLKMVEKELKEAKENLERQNVELKKLDKIKDGIIRDVSHELKTPVAKLSMQLEILKAALAKMGHRDDLKKPLQVMDMTIKRQESAIRNILELSRLESGGRLFCYRQMGLHRMLASVIDDYRHDLEAMNISISADLEPLEIQSDKDMIWHVFSNLLHNAIKFMKRDSLGEIAVSLSRDGENAVVNIKDNGIGMNKEETVRAFEPFYQASPSKEGCGVGLSICKMIVEELGGRIRIESGGPGKGSAVTVSLPSLVRKKAGPEAD